MEIQTTETSENSVSLPVTNTETTDTNEALDQITPPVTAHPEPTDTSEPPPPPVTTMPETEPSPSPPEITTTQTSETLEPTTPSPEITNTHTTEPPSDDSISTLPPVTPTQTSETTLNQSTLPPLTDTKPTETIDQSVVMVPVVTDNSHDNIIPSENHQVMEMRHETPEEGEEVRSVLKVIAATGKFCSHDWEKFRSMLSLHLKQVISEYPQAKMTIEEQKVALGETGAELAKRLDDALHSFVDGPPFTIQRLSEIILDARSLYPNLSKLALALEKNLSVTSTLTMLTDPYPPSSLIPTTNGVDKVTEDPNPEVESDAVMENGVADVIVSDVVMTEVEGDVSDVVMTMEVETESSPMTTGDS